MTTLKIKYLKHFAMHGTYTKDSMVEEKDNYMRKLHRG